MISKQNRQSNKRWSRGHLSGRDVSRACKWPCDSVRQCHMPQSCGNLQQNINQYSKASMQYFWLLKRLNSQKKRQFQVLVTDFNEIGKRLGVGFSTSLPKCLHYFRILQTNNICLRNFTKIGREIRSVDVNNQFGRIQKSNLIQAETQTL